MDKESLVGRVHSLQSLGTVDGPGIRFVVFMQGCNLRCGYCHNPDTWKSDTGTLYTPKELIEKIIRYKTYFGAEGGVTVSGGEPLLQAEFVTELFCLCHKNNINTCLDTSGSIMNDKVTELLKHTDRVLLDIKFTNNEDYKKYTGCSFDAPLAFLGYLNCQNIPVTIRQVIVPQLNDNEESITKLKRIADDHSCVDKVELLPFKKICKVKYDNLGLNFTFDCYDTPSKELMVNLNKHFEL